MSLIAACPGRFERPRAEALLASIGDSQAASRLLSTFDAESRVLDGRLRRCRNGLMHGNPVFLESVLSVRGFSRFVVSVALDDSVRSIAEGRPVLDVIQERSRRRQATVAAIQNGASFYDTWSGADGSR